MNTGVRPEWQINTEFNLCLFPFPPKQVRALLVDFKCQYIIYLCLFIFPPKAKDVHSNNKREEKYEKISLIKGTSCHTRRLIFLSSWTAMPLPSVLAARLLQSSLPWVSPCLACMSFDYDSSPFNIVQTRHCHVPSAV